jgi:carbamoyltransferase
LSSFTLGISAYYHDSAAAIVRDGDIMAAAQEERFSRQKHDAAFPEQSIRFCLEAAGISAGDLGKVVFYDKPLLKFERLLETHLDFAPRGFRSFATSMPVWLKEKLFLKKQLVRQLGGIDPAVDWQKRLLFSEHHLSHAASAFFPSPFSEALILTMDGVGEWATTTVADGRGESIEILREIHFPHSLGLLYSAFTAHLGYKVNSGEYKVMGLAPYGEPVYADRILSEIIDLKQDGSFRLNLDYFNYCTDLKMTSSRFAPLFGVAERKPEGPLSKAHFDLAASIQEVIEVAVLRLGRSLARETGRKNLCLAGGVALNCVANGKLLREGCFERIWIQPAAGDAGAALGAALVGAHLHGGVRRKIANGDSMAGAFLGPEYSDAEVEKSLRRLGATFHRFSEDGMIEACAEALAQGQAVGWFQGRMEFGPRALGARSILADARSPEMQQQLNLKIKFRESFRPFAPAVLQEEVADWFDYSGDSPYMLFVAEVAEKRRRAPAPGAEPLEGLDLLHLPRSEIPAVTHVDNTARLQTVHRETNPRFHRLLSAFHAKSGCPVLVNTSFNVRGEPIVCNPEDAYRCFMDTGLDMLVLGNFVLRKSEQKAPTSGKREFEPD